MAQPTFQPVTLNVFPMLSMVIVRSYIPGSVAIERCGRAEGDLRVDLVGDDHHVVPAAELGDGFQLGARNILPVGLCGVFRMSARVRGPNAAASRAGSNRQSGGASGTARTVAARHGDVGRVGVVGRLEDDHLVAGIDDRQQRVVQQLGRAARDRDLGVRIDRPAPSGQRRR